MCQLKDLTRKFLNAKLSKVKSADGGEDGIELKLPKSKAHYKLQRVCKTTGVWCGSDGHVEMVHTKATDTWQTDSCLVLGIGCRKGLLGGSPLLGPKASATAQDFFNGQLNYEGLHFSSPELNDALNSQETDKAVCEFRRLIEIAQSIVERQLSRD